MPQLSSRCKRFKELAGFLGLLSKQKIEAPLDEDPVAREPVVWRKSRRMGRDGRLPARRNVLQGVNSVPVFVQVVHQKHFTRCIELTACKESRNFAHKLPKLPRTKPGLATTRTGNNKKTCKKQCCQMLRLVKKVKHKNPHLPPCRYMCPHGSSEGKTKTI